MRFVLAVVLIALAVGTGRTDPIVSEQSLIDSVLQDERERAVLDEPLTGAFSESARLKVLDNPELSYLRESLGQESRQQTWTLSWTLPLDGRQRLKGQAADATVRAAESRREASRNQLRAQAREAFAKWVIAEESSAVGERVALLVDRLARQAESSAAEGEASALSARRLLLARIEVRAQAARLMAELAHARARIRVWMPGLAPTSRPARPALPPVPGDSTAWVRSPHLIALEREIRQAEVLAGLANRFWALPEWSIGRQAAQGGSDEITGPVYGVRWRLPVFDRQQGDRIATRGRLTGVRARLELEQARAREDFAAAVTSYTLLRESAELSLLAGPAGTSALTGAVALFDSGEADMTDLLESIRGVLSAELAALDSYGAALRAHRELELTTGQSLPLTEGAGR